MEIKGKTVAEVIEAIANKETSTIEIANDLESSERTVQRRIKALGYKWNQLNNRHEPTGNEYKPGNDSKIFSDLVIPESKREAQSASKEIASTSEVTVPEPRPRNKSSKTRDKDMLAMFLGDQSTRIQRNYYMSEDILSVVDKVHALKRSEFINQCLRQYFKDNDLL